MRGGLLTSALLASAIVGSFTATAAAAPTSVKPPRISGTPAYLSTLTCHTGTWSSDAVSFTYEWQAGGVTIATRRMVTVPLQAIGYSLDCTVTAHDAKGATTSATSASVHPRPATPKIRITRAKVSKRTITLSGTISPRRAATKHGDLVLDRKTSSGLTQLTFNAIHPKAGGRFTVKAKDSVAGKHTYVLLYNPGTPGFADQVQVKRTLTLR